MLCELDLIWTHTFESEYLQCLELEGFQAISFENYFLHLLVSLISDIASAEPYYVTLVVKILRFRHDLDNNSAMVFDIVLFERLLGIPEDSTKESIMVLLSDPQALSSFQMLGVRMQCRQVH